MHFNPISLFMHNPFMLETTRLLIRPLTYDQLVKYLQNDHSLENELNLNASNRSIAAELKEALEQTLLPNVANPAKNYLYCTIWTLIHKNENTMVGDLCIVDEPNEAGEIEIGYGTYDDHRSQGYMTEAVGAIIEWASTQPKVKSIIASTEKDNIASYKILEKNGFVKSGETDVLFQWSLSL